MSTITPIQELTLSFSVKNRRASADWFKKHFGFEEQLTIDEAGWTELSPMLIQPAPLWKLRRLSSMGIH